MVAYLQRIYTVVELRTGFVAGSSIFLGCAYGMYQSAELKLFLTCMLFISAFCLNLVANIAAEISGYLSGEDSEEFLTGHHGSEGLARKDASLQDALIILVICSIMAGLSGIIVVILTQKYILLLIGLSGFLIALIYSLTPIALAKFPVSEMVSGLMCGFLCTLAGIIIYIPIDSIAIALCMMTLLMVSFLMAANNTCDYYKDLQTRRTWPHIIGFRASITVLIPQIIILFILWFYVGLTLNSPLILLIGTLVLIRFGIFKWYLPYYQIKEYQAGLAQKFGPLPLTLLLNFNFIMSSVFIILTIKGG